MTNTSGSIYCGSCKAEIAVGYVVGEFFRLPPGWLMKLTGEDEPEFACSAPCAEDSEAYTKVHKDGYASGLITYENRGQYTMRKVDGRWDWFMTEEARAAIATREQQRLGRLANGALLGHAVLTCRKCGKQHDKGCPAIPGQDDSNYVCEECTR